MQGQQLYIISMVQIHIIQIRLAQQLFHQSQFLQRRGTHLVDIIQLKVEMAHNIFLPTEHLQTIFIQHILQIKPFMQSGR